MSEIPEFLDQEPAPGSVGGEMSLVETWIAAFTKPNESTFAEIAAQPGASTGKAFLWVFVASLLTSFASLISRSVGFGNMGDLQRFLPPEIARDIPMNVPSWFGFGTVICGTPVAALLAVIGFAIGAALIQWVAKLFGGTGSFDKLAYTFSAIMVPYSVVVAVLTLIGMIPIVGYLTGLVSFGLLFYMLVLEVQAVKAVNGLDTGKAVGAVLIPGFAIFFFICCCVIVALAAMGPVIENVFNQISQGLY